MPSPIPAQRPHAAGGDQLWHSIHNEDLMDVVNGRSIGIKPQSNTNYDSIAVFGNNTARPTTPHSEWGFCLYLTEYSGGSPTQVNSRYEQLIEWGLYIAAVMPVAIISRPLFIIMTNKLEVSSNKLCCGDLLVEELGPMYVGLRHFHDTYFGGMADLHTASNVLFKLCLEGSDPLFQDGWRGWPKDANQDDVLNWFAGFSDKLASFANVYKSNATIDNGARLPGGVEGIALRHLFVDKP
ncbi:hypothetical protein MKZ38_005118 [Zalerion maritima]|uniref:Uncharacterized protein n=1 Tax=Zalerion maritima TaxID=339359 RepID=A0AAD5RKZ6_9PEZI|nr:hypothetical protein MKZ38_005118 [Zalerion maritima]